MPAGRAKKAYPGGGWVQGRSNPPPAEPVIAMLAKYSRRFRHVGDSISNNHSLPGIREYYFSGARNNTINDTATDVTKAQAFFDANGISFYVSADSPHFSTWTLMNP